MSEHFKNLAVGIPAVMLVLVVGAALGWVIVFHPLWFALGCLGGMLLIATYGLGWSIRNGWGAPKRKATP